MNRDQFSGRIESAKGRAKIVVGKVIGDKRLERKGMSQDTMGRAQAVYGDLKQDIKRFF